MNQKTRYKFDKDEIKELKEIYKTKDNKEALELWAYNEYDLKHNCSLIIGKIGNNFIDIVEMP